MCIKHFAPIAAIKALDESILGGRAFLDELDFNSLLVHPVFEFLSDKFRAVIDAQALRLGMLFNDLLQGSNDAAGG